MRDFNELNFVTKDTVADKLSLYWREELAQSYPQASDTTRVAIVEWLVGNDAERFAALAERDWEIAISPMRYRWKILRQRYFGVSPEIGYRNLMTHLGCLVISREKIKIWISLHRDTQRAMLDLLESVLLDLLQTDNYMQEQMAYIATLTSDTKLKNALLFASTEEYCLRSVNQQPFFLYLCIHHILGRQLKH